MTTLFGLLFWDVLFLDIPGVFESPFQSAPLDLGTIHFYETRRAQIEARLQEIEQGMYLDRIRQVDARERRRGSRCVGMDFRENSCSRCLMERHVRGNPRDCRGMFP